MAQASENYNHYIYMYIVLANEMWGFNVFINLMYFLTLYRFHKCMTCTLIYYITICNVSSVLRIQMKWVLCKRHWLGQYSMVSIANTWKMIKLSLTYKYKISLIVIIETIKNIIHSLCIQIKNKGNWFCITRKYKDKTV